jgi:putative ABC transport system permease protein
MESIFGIPATQIMQALVATTGAVLGFILVVIARRRVLVRLGLRHIPRRPGRSALIIFGLALSTTIIATAFATGDTITYTVRALVAGGLGRADEVVIANPGAFTRSRLAGAELSALWNGALSAVSGADFPQGEATRVQAILEREPRVQAVLPAIVEPAAVTNLTRRESISNFAVLAVPAEEAPRFGRIWSIDGHEVFISDLGPLEAFVNQAAAELLAIEPGDRLRLRVRPEPIEVTVHALVANGDFGGEQPTVLLNLADFQAATKRQGKINQIMIANSGDPVHSVRHSEAVTRQLRAALADRRAATALLRALASDAAREQLRGLSSGLLVSERVRTKVERLIAETHYPAPTDEFLYLLGDYEVAAHVLRVAGRYTPGGGARAADLLRQLSPLAVLDVKQASLDAADDAGSALTAVFIVLGLCSIASGILLIFLLFSVLAAERRTEMGMARVLGMQRHHLVSALCLEGLAYDIAAAFIGTGLGVLASHVVVAAIAGILREFDLRVSQHVELRSLVIAYCLGLLVSLMTIGFAAWHTSRMNLVAALRNLPDDERPVRRQDTLRRLFQQLRLQRIRGAIGAAAEAVFDATRAGIVAWPVLLAAGWWVLQHAAASRQALPYALAGWLIAFGLAFLARWLLAVPAAVPQTALLHAVRRGERLLPPSVRNRIAYTLAGILLLLWWLLPLQPRPLIRIWPWTAGIWRFPGPVNNPDLFPLAGVTIIAGAVLIVANNYAALLSVLRTLGELKGPWRRLAPALRLGTMYPAAYPFRTGLSLAMFSLVVATMGLTATLLHGVRFAYQDLNALTGGFQIRAQATEGAAAPARLPELLPAAEGFRIDSIASMGSLATLSVEAIQPGVKRASWRPLGANVIDRGFAEHTELRLTGRAPGYASDREVWRALVEQPGLALITGHSVPSRAEAASEQPGSSFFLNGVYREERTIRPQTIWIRDPRGGRAVKLTVIGVLDARTSFAPGLYLSSETLALTGNAPPPPRAYYLRLHDGVPPRQAALGLSMSLGSQGIQFVPVGEEVRRAQSVRVLLNLLLESYLGLGLIAGVASLGIVGLRAVVERRQHIGVLRALGYRRWMVQAAFLVEFGLIAAVGTLIGTATGVYLARQVVRLLGRGRADFFFAVPWDQIGLILLITVVAALLSALPPAWQAGRIPPAQAIRYE